MAQLKVGQSEVLGNRNALSYRAVPCDEFGWVDASKYLPADYDMMYLKVKGKKNTTGWSVGKNWDGLRITENDEILYWKKKVED